MQIRVEELARLEGVRVDTIRYYRKLGLLPPPERSGRVAFYGQEHRDRLVRIRELRDQGFKLAQIARLLAEPGAGAGPGAREGLLEALVEEQAGGRTFDRESFAREAGIPAELLTAAQAAGLITPIQAGDEGAEERFAEADLAMARAGLELLGAGFPLHELLALAVGHARHVDEVADQAIALFDRDVRKDASGTVREASDVTEQFRRLLPLLTRLVAQHFQRTLVHRALARAAQGGNDAQLSDALAATEAALEVNVAWR